MIRTCWQFGRVKLQNMPKNLLLCRSLPTASTRNCIHTYRYNWNVALEYETIFQVVCDWINKHYPVTSTLFGKREPLPSKSELLEVHDIEENIWDTKLGLKGKVDVTMQTKQHKGIESLELKTGKSHASSDHTAQVLLYCMMHSSRYEQPVGFGNILYLKVDWFFMISFSKYLQDGVSRVVIPRAAELLGILQQRNNLSVFFEDPTLDQLPRLFFFLNFPVLKSPF